MGQCGSSEAAPADNNTEPQKKDGGAAPAKQEPAAQPAANTQQVRPTPTETAIHNSELYVGRRGKVVKPGSANDGKIGVIVRQATKGGWELQIDGADGGKKCYLPQHIEPMEDRKGEDRKQAPRNTGAPAEAPADTASKADDFEESEKQPENQAAAPQSGGGEAAAAKPARTEENIAAEKTDREKAGDFYDSLDTDGTGSLSWNELNEAMKRGDLEKYGLEAEEGLLESYLNMDDDQDGKVTRDEWIDWLVDKRYGSGRGIDEEQKDDAAEPEAEVPVITKRPSVIASEPPAAKSITITERPFGFGAMNGPQFIGAQITSIKNKKWQNPETPEAFLKSGLFISSIESSSANDGEGGVEDVKYVVWRDISKKLKKYVLPITFSFWSGPEVEQACEAAFKDADISPDGHITWDEFQAFTHIIGDELEIDEGLLHEEFDRYAKDADGNELDYLDVETFKLAIAALQNDWDKHPDNPNLQ